MTRHSLTSEPLTDAEKIRTIYELITNPHVEGGAGITPQRGEWKSVESIFPLHDHDFNKELMKKLTSSYVLSPEDLDQVRNKFGEKVNLPPS